MSFRLLYVEDDRLFLETIKDYLSSLGYLCDVATSAEEGLELTYKNNYDLYLLDIKISPFNGIEMLKMLREANDETPAMFLTSYKDMDMLEEAFCSGGDDYLRKPFELVELNHRIRSILRRVGKCEEGYKIGKNRYFIEDESVIKSENGRVRISKKEAILLKELLDNRGKTVLNERIYELLWRDGEPKNSSLRVYINRLNKVLGEDSIKNIRGEGYKFEG